jgi:hypothetical protein
MPDEDRSGGEAISVGSWRGCAIELVPHDAVDAPVELSIAGVFTHERPGTRLSGGLRRLDDALGGAVRRLRADGIVSGALGDTMLLSAPAAPIRSTAVLMVGLGAPEDWLVTSLARAVAAAAEQALRLRVRSAAFAPGLLDSGVIPAEVAGAPAVMLGALLDALTEAPKQLDRWMFCVGPERLEDAARQFRLAFHARTAS